MTPPLPHLRDWTWLHAYRAQVRQMFPWARVPFATLHAHRAEFLIYDCPDAAGPLSVVIRSDEEPHRHPVDLIVVDGWSVHAVQLAVAQLAHDEIEAGHPLVDGADPTT